MQAEARINHALEHNAHLMHMKRQAYEQKEAEAEARRKEMEVVSLWGLFTVVSIDMRSGFSNVVI